ncbi:MAG TPA: hypothetical protein VJB87_04380 [Candidatus Nanoarchaeia archaeon]|nr:hypothetical protein [Candidatus Nanoarchaeia archaeon]
MVRRLVSCGLKECVNMHFNQTTGYRSANVNVLVSLLRLLPSVFPDWNFYAALHVAKEEDYGKYSLHMGWNKDDFREKMTWDDKICRQFDRLGKEKILRGGRLRSVHFSAGPMVTSPDRVYDCLVEDLVILQAAGYKQFRFEMGYNVHTKPGSASALWFGDVVLAVNNYASTSDFQFAYRKELEGSSSIATLTDCVKYSVHGMKFVDSESA